MSLRCERLTPILVHRPCMLADPSLWKDHLQILHFLTWPAKLSMGRLRQMLVIDTRPHCNGAFLEFVVALLADVTGVNEMFSALWRTNRRLFAADRICDFDKYVHQPFLFVLFAISTFPRYTTTADLRVVDRHVDVVLGGGIAGTLQLHKVQPVTQLFDLIVQLGDDLGACPLHRVLSILEAIAYDVEIIVTLEHARIARAFAKKCAGLLTSAKYAQGLESIVGQCTWLSRATWCGAVVRAGFLREKQFVFLHEHILKKHKL